MWQTLSSAARTIGDRVAPIIQDVLDSDNEGQDDQSLGVDNSLSIFKEHESEDLAETSDFDPNFDEATKIAIEHYKNELIKARQEIFDIQGKLLAREYELQKLQQSTAEAFAAGNAAPEQKCGGNSAMAGEDDNGVAKLVSLQEQLARSEAARAEEERARKDVQAALAAELKEAKEALATAGRRRQGEEACAAPATAEPAAGGGEGDCQQDGGAARTEALRAAVGRALEAEAARAAAEQGQREAEAALAAARQELGRAEAALAAAERRGGAAEAALAAAERRGDAAAAAAAAAERGREAAEGALAAAKQERGELEGRLEALARRRLSRENSLRQEAQAAAAAAGAQREEGEAALRALRDQVAALREERDARAKGERGLREELAAVGGENGC